MTYPQQQWPAQNAAPAQYPPAAPGYPPAQYPQQPQQQFSQPYAMGPGYPVPQMAPPPVPLAQGSLDDFYNQPSTGGGKSLVFKVVGTRYRFIVPRPLGPGDVQQQTDTQQKPLFFRDGRPKFVMKVPVQMQPTPEYPDGMAVWYVKGQARDELVRAMAEAGAPAGPPEPLCMIDVTYTGDRQSGVGMNPAKQVHVVYTRPNGAPSVAQQPAQPPQAPAQPDPRLTAYAQAAQPDLAAMQAAQQAQFAQAGAPVQTMPPAQAQYVQPQLPMPEPAAQPVQQQGPQQPMAMPADLSAEQQQLLARLTGQQQQ